jgi:hypothetical protein
MQGDHATLVYTSYLSLSILGFALSTLPQLSFPYLFSSFPALWERQNRGREMEMLTTSSVLLRPMSPKITKMPFSLAIPRPSLSTHALGKRAVQETVQLETSKEERRKHGDLVLYSMAPYSLVLAAKLLPGGNFGLLISVN